MMTTNLEKYLDHVVKAIDVEGVYPIPGLVLRSDGKVELFAFAIGADEIVSIARNQCRRTDVAEIIISLDTWCALSQGTTFNSCLIVFHICRGQPTHIGVLEYEWVNGKAFTKPVDWENTFWNARYTALASSLTIISGD